MKKYEASIFGVIIANLISRYLARDRKRAEYIVAQTFPGCRIGRIRKDAGTKKVRNES
jgi:hypothetical protein